MPWRLVGPGGALLGFTHIDATADNVTAPTPRPTRSLRATRVATGLVLVVLTVTLLPSPAGAHAVVISASPGAGDRLTSAPTTASVTFSEAVSPDVGGLHVLDQAGNPVDAGATAQPAPQQLQIALRPGLPDGTYVTNYRVISADGHPVAGAVVWNIGSGSVADVGSLAARTEPALDVAAGIARWLLYVSVLLCVGLAFFIAFVHDGESDEAPLRRWVRITTIVAGAVVVVTIAAQAALAIDAAAGAWDLEAWRAVLRQGLGLQSAVVLVGLALCHLSVDVRRGTAAHALAFYGGLVTSAGFVLWGHALQSPHRWVAVVADVIHVGAAAAWFGGLVGMAATIVARVRRGGDPTVLRSTAVMVSRFSTVAAVSVVLLAVAGIGLTYGEIASLDQLTSTAYGRTLLAKLAVVLVVLAVGGYNRFQLVPWLEAGIDAPVEPPAESDVEPLAGAPDDAQTADAVAVADERDGWRVLARTMRLEAVLIVVVLAVTAALVNVPPPIDAANQSEPFVATRTLEDGLTVEFIVTPNRAGTNSFHVTYTDPDGRIDDRVRRAQLELRLPEKNVGPITRDMIKVGAGHFTLENVNDMAIPGTWDITLVSRTGDFDQVRTTFQDTIT